jgi:hypothetical protein
VIPFYYPRKKSTRFLYTYMKSAINSAPVSWNLKALNVSKIEF